MIMRQPIFLVEGAIDEGQLLVVTTYQSIDNMIMYGSSHLRIIGFQMGPYRHQSTSKKHEAMFHGSP